MSKYKAPPEALEPEFDQIIEHTLTKPFAIYHEFATKRAHYTKGVKTPGLGGPYGLTYEWRIEWALKLRYLLVYDTNMCLYRFEVYALKGVETHHLEEWALARSDDVWAFIDKFYAALVGEKYESVPNT